jgi:hypothetical protein
MREKNENHPQQITIQKNPIAEKATKFPGRLCLKKCHRQYPNPSGGSLSNVIIRESRPLSTKSMRSQVIPNNNNETSARMTPPMVRRIDDFIAAGLRQSALSN